MDSIELSVVIPVYNSEQSLPILLARLESALGGMGRSFEVILVNDGSRDRSWPVILEKKKQFPWLKALNLMRNYGQHNALLAGIYHASGEFVITLDDDLQNPPEEIPKLLSAMTAEVDVVYGAREQERHGIFRNLGSKLTKRFLKALLDFPIATNITSFRIFRSSLRGSFSEVESSCIFIDALLAWSTNRIIGIKVRHESRSLGISNYTLRRLFGHAANIITAFSVLPLQFASILGFAFVAFGILLLVQLLISYALGKIQVPGFTFLATIICLFSGIQLIVLGIFGAYLARIHQNLRRTKTFSIREIV